MMQQSKWAFTKRIRFKSLFSRLSLHQIQSLALQKKHISGGELVRFQCLAVAFVPVSDVIKAIRWRFAWLFWTNIKRSVDWSVIVEVSADVSNAYDRTMAQGICKMSPSKNSCRTIEIRNGDCHRIKLDGTLIDDSFNVELVEYFPTNISLSSMEFLFQSLSMNSFFRISHRSVHWSINP